MTDRQTHLLHNPYTPPDNYDAFPTPVCRASTILFDSVASLRSRDWRDRDCFTYGLHGTPTTFVLEKLLCDMDGAKHCLLAPSGLSAISMVDFAFLRTGDDVLIPENAYGPNKEMGEWLRQDFGVSVRLYDPLIGSKIADMIQDNTKLIWAETPGSITMEIPDLVAISKAAHEKGVIVAVDNTYSAGLTYDAFAHGADINLYALTKYHSGGSDILMGAVLTKEDHLYEKLCFAHMRLGVGVSSDDISLVLRSLPSLKLRYEKHAEVAMEIATWLKKRPEISHVLHPAFEDCPGHEIFKRDFTGPGGLFSILFHPRYSEAQTDRFVEALQFFKIGYSWGGTHSLCVPYRISRSSWPHSDKQLVRLYIGLEEPKDLIADLENALKAL